MAVGDKLKSLMEFNNPGAHNGIYRGKYLGSSVTAAQYAAISAGTFDDLYIGDYWTIGGVNYRIAAFDYWYNCGDTACTTHHVVIVPDTCLGSNKQMNTTNITNTGYYGSAMRGGDNYPSGGNIADAVTIINNAFGSAHILSHRELLTNAANDYATAGSWCNSTIDLMNEAMVYGGQFFANVINQGNVPYSYTIDKGQLPLFALRPDLICNRANWWLRDVVSATNFALVSDSGTAHPDGASDSGGVRPAFGLVA